MALLIIYSEPEVKCAAKYFAQLRDPTSFHGGQAYSI